MFIYQCHCKDDVQCTQDTGDCPDGCADDFTGLACQYSKLSNFVLVQFSAFNYI